MKTLSNKLLLTLSCVTLSAMANEVSDLNDQETLNAPVDTSLQDIEPGIQTETIGEVYNNTAVDLKKAAERFFGEDKNNLDKFMSEREGEQTMQLDVVQLVFINYIKDPNNNISEKYTDKYINERLMEVYRPIAEKFFNNKEKLENSKFIGNLDDFLKEGDPSFYGLVEYAYNCGMTGAADIYQALSDNSLKISDVEDKVKMVEFEPTVKKLLNGIELGQNESNDAIQEFLRGSSSPTLKNLIEFSFEKMPEDVEKEDALELIKSALGDEANNVDINAIFESMYG